jgi:glycosyltransferase involved in cell wall biosynthesis
MAATADLTVVALVLGQFWKLEAHLAELYASLRAVGSRAQVVVAYDGPAWRGLPIVGQFHDACPWARAITLRDAFDHPARLINAGLAETHTEFCSVVWPGASCPIDALAELAGRLEAHPEFAAAVATLEDSYPPHYNEVHTPFLQCVNGISLQGAVFRTAPLRAIGGADPNPLFQRVPEWDLFLRLAERSPIDYCPSSLAPPSIRWEAFPFCKPIPASVADIRRCVVKADRYRPSSGDGTSARLDLPGLPPEDHQRIESLRAACDLAVTSATKPDVLRVTVTGGIWEPHHNQLCFYNYFELAEGRCQFHWQPVLDYLATPDDIEGSDLVIISRGRCANIRRILGWCEAARIPSLYMIDDNWFTVASDWNAYKDLFSPGRPDYEMFLEALRRCTATVVYSPVLEEYVRPHARRVVRIPINIRLDRFLPYRPPPPPEDRPLLAGYTGSLRYTDAAFVGLAEFVRRRRDARLFYFGDLNYLPAALRGVTEADNYRCVPHTRNYAAYARRIAEEQPDVLLAPLDDSATSRSKCFNKYLEITAAGATGIYSGIAPYTEVVRDGVNGLLIDPARNEEPEAWREALDRLYADRRLCRALADRALEDVQARFDTRARYPEFLAMVRDVIEWGRGDGGCG